MKKKKIYNVGMVIIILCIAFCGLAAVGITKGWFTQDAVLYVSQKTGIVVVERHGLAYEVQKSSVIQAGDVLHTHTAAELEISDGKEKIPHIWLSGNTDFSITETDGHLVFEVSKGEAFADTKGWENAAVFVFREAELTAHQAVMSISTRNGSSMVSVYSGKVSAAVDDTKQTILSGQVMCVAENAREKNSITVSALQPFALNDFQMTRLLAADMDDGFCFAEADLREIKQIREKERMDAQQAKILAENTRSPEKKSDAGTKDEKSAEEGENKTVFKKSGETDADAADENTSRESHVSKSENKSEDTSDTGDVSGKKPKKTNEDKSKEVSEKLENTAAEDEKKPKRDTLQEETIPKETIPKETETSTEEATPEDTAQYCTIEIRCDTILNHMENLAPGKDVYVPLDGTLLASSKVEFTTGETAFDILKRACERIEMPLEYSYTPLYESYYVEGINQLYEFDCGTQSGWVYKVNGWFPNYGCSAYPVQKDDAIVFCYTCTGLGTDVGGGNY